eukprot:g8214.t1
MFQSAHQGGDYVEVFSPAGKNPGSEWKSSGKIVRVFEKGVKGYVLTVSGGATSKMQLPKAPKGLLGLRQRHLVLQVLTAASQDKPFSLELGLKDSGGTRRRLVLSSSFKALHCTPLHAQVPLVGLDRHRGTWANLSIDLAGLTAVCFRADAFSSLELISIGPTCRLRKIFTMKDGLDDWEDGGGEDNDEPVGGATAPGPIDGGRCEPAQVAPVPVRMAFPAGVVPTPRNWVISLSTLRRLVCRDVGSPSPSKRTSFAAASSAAGRTRRSRPVPSPSQSSFRRGPPSLSPTSASLRMSGAQQGMPSSRGGAKERGTASPRLLEIVAGKSSSSSSPRLLDIVAGKSSSSSGTRASPTGLLPRQRSTSSRGSSGASARPPATPPPLATPARNGGNISSCLDSRPPSSSPGKLGSSTPGCSTARDGGDVGLAGREGGIRSGNTGTPSFRRTPSRAATTTPGSPGRSIGSVAKDNYGDMEGSGGRGVLPARRRLAEAYLSGGITDEMGQTRIADGGGGGTSDRGGHMNRAPAEEWRVAGCCGEQNGGHAPAWSFRGGNDNYGFSSDDVSRMATPKSNLSSSVKSPLGSPLTELGTTAPASSIVRSALVSATRGDTRGAASGSEDDGKGEGQIAVETSSSSIQASHDALPADIDVSWREGHCVDDGEAVASSKRFSSTVRLSSPPSRACPPHYTIPSSTAAGTPTALGTPGRSYPAECTFERKESGARETRSAAQMAHLFASTFSALGDGQQAARSSTTAPDGGASRSDGRSPISARVELLQNLLGPDEKGEDNVAPPGVCTVAPTATRRTSDDTNLAKASTKPSLEEKDGIGGSSAVEGDEILDAAERLLGRGSEDVSQNTAVVGGFVGTSAKRERTHPGLEGGCQQAEATESLPTPETKGTDLRPTRPRAQSGVDASEPERKVTQAGPTDEFDAIERRQFDNTEGLLRPSYSPAARKERWDEQKAGPRPAIGERFDELAELKRKEIALLNLEESSPSEFGSVDLSQSPEKREPFIGNYSPAQVSAAAGNFRTVSSTTTTILGDSSASGGQGRPNGGAEPPFGWQDYRQRASVGDISNNDGDADSAVLGSRASTASAAPGERTVEEEPGARARSVAKGGEGVVKRGARDRGSGVGQDSNRGQERAVL